MGSCRCDWGRAFTFEQLRRRAFETGELVGVGQEHLDVEKRVSCFEDRFDFPLESPPVSIDLRFLAGEHGVDVFASLLHVADDDLVG